MGQKYVVFMPVDPRVRPDAEKTRAVVEKLFEIGAVQGALGDPSSWRNGPNFGAIFRDTDPRKIEGGLGTDPGRIEFRVYEGEIVGFCGDNLEPVACIHCTSELPYNAAQDAFWGLRDGKPVDDPCMTMECFHCGKGNLALEADWGRSGGFAQVAFVFDGELSNRCEANPAGIELFASALGTPVRFAQVFSW